METGKMAFVLTGGGCFGAVQVGMLKALTAWGIKPDLVIGGSVGAINAVYFAQYPNAKGLEDLTTAWSNLKREDVLPTHPLGVFLGLTRHLGLFPRNHLLSAKALEKLLKRHLDGLQLENSAIERHVVATNLSDGGEVLISEGSCVNALLASTAIPILFPPVRCGGRYLIDGAVGSHTPIEAAIKLGAKRIIVLPTGMSCARKRDDMPKDALEMALHTVNLLVARQLTGDIKSFQDCARITIVPPVCPLDTSIFSFGNTGELIPRGERETQVWLEDGGLESTGIPETIKPHDHY